MMGEDESDREFLTLFLANESDLRAFMGSVVADRHAWDNVFQEVALTLWRSFDKFDRSRRFGAWARGVAANKVLQEWRKGARFPLAMPEEMIEAFFVGERKREAVMAGIGETPEKTEGGWKWAAAAALVGLIGLTGLMWGGGGIVYRGER